MNKELMEALDILEKEKEISKETLFTDFLVKRHSLRQLRTL